MSSYAELAPVYDRLMQDVPYDAWIAYYEKVWAEHCKRPTLLLDVGCGTGTISYALAARGIDVIGCDPSEEMLAVAGEKGRDLEPRPLFICQSAEELDLYGTVDGVISSLDCLNYLPGKVALGRALARISLFMEPGALMIFDLNTPEKLASLDGQTVIKEGEGAYCVWQSSWNARSKKCTFALDLFTEEDGRWLRGYEEQRETAFSRKDVEDCLKTAGLELLQVAAPSPEMPETAEERLFFIARKPL